MTTFALLAIAALLTFGTAALAKKNGRNPWIAGTLGFIFGIFALIGYLIAGETEEKKTKRMRDALKD